MNELIDKYSSLSIGEKRKELGHEISELTFVTEKLLADILPDYELKNVKEFVNLFDENLTEDEYLTGLYGDILELQEAIGTYYDIVTNIYCDDNHTE